MGQFVLLMDHLRVHDAASFKNMTRLTPDKFFAVCDRLEPRIKKQHTFFREPLEPALRLAVALRYYASGDKYISLEYNWLVAHNTVGKIVNEVSEAIIAEYADEVIDTPILPEKWKEVADRFSKRWNFHHTLGALDGKHVAIRCPAKSGSDFYNYKKYYSLILMALVDGNYRFLWVNVGANGASSDAQIWNGSDLQELIEQKKMGIPEPEPLPGDNQPVPYFIVGDDAFALRTFMMKPFGSRDLTHPHKVFNYRLSRARRIVENAFGILAQRFQCLLTTMRQTPKHVTAIVLACCCLHNLLLNDNPNLTRGMVDEEDDDHEIIPGTWREEGCLGDGTKDQNAPNTSSKQGKDVRSYLCDYYNSPLGAVEWQDRMADRR